jgi:beta-glucosidase
MPAKKVKYLDVKLSIDVRAKDLLSRMTMEEKVKQLCVIVPDQILDNGLFSQDKAYKELNYGISQVAMLVRNFLPKQGAELVNQVQKFLTENTRLKIPAVIHDECIHGCMAKVSTSYPHSIAMGSTWNPELMEQVATEIGRETRARGIHHALSPTINIARDPRVSRMEETYGEDTYLTSRMGVAFIKGIQSQKVAATAKHFVANFVGDGGRDSHAVHFTERLMREVYFPAFEACVKEAGVWSIMPAYNSYDGLPCSANKWLLTQVLRNEWGFKGINVSDYGSVIGIQVKHHVAPTKGMAAKLALEAGMDIEYPNADCYAEVLSMVKKGEISPGLINRAVERVLRMKFWLGLFENPFVDVISAVKTGDTDDHRQLALEAARQTMVLLKNDKQMLPIKKEIRSIAVIGPNANEVQLGTYSTLGIKVVTPLEGIKKIAPGNVEVSFAEGCKIRDVSKYGFDAAIAAAVKADVVVMVMGNKSGLPDVDPEMSEGEQNDRCNLDLPGVQQDLIDEVADVNKNIIVVLVNGGVITMKKWAGKVSAILESWYSSAESGTAIAETLFGINNPGGKLPLTFPQVTGQVPLYYNQKPTGRIDDYVDLRGKQPLFPFGHGLSYTKFTYSGLNITKTKRQGKVNVTIMFDLTNSGDKAGVEIAQLYIHDSYSSYIRPVKELKRFSRVHLGVNETRHVEFVLNEQDLSFLGKNLKLVFEPGEFEFMIGSSSEDIRLQQTLKI